MDFSAFDTAKIDEYAKKAKEQWGNTAAYKEYEKKAEGRSKEEEVSVMEEFMGLFAEFGKIKDKAPESSEAQAMVQKLKDYITEHFYNCTDDILSGLGKAYVSGNEFTQNIDKAGGVGTASFASKAIAVYCGK